MMRSDFVFFCLLFSIEGDKAREQNNDKCFLTCQKGWEKNGERCYWWQNDPKIWAEAEQFCKDKGAHLASVTSLNIHNYIWSKIEPTGRSVWVGGSDQDQEGQWMWIDGSN